MSTGPDMDAERDVDLAKWRDAIVRRWWVGVAGLAAGAIVGGFYSLSGGSIYEASVLLRPSQAFSPNGASVLSYQSSPLNINEIAVSPNTLAEVVAQVAKKDGIHIELSKLVGGVSTTTVSTGTGSSTATRGSLLIKLRVQLPKAKETAAAANALGSIIAATTTGQYVLGSIKTLQIDVQSSQRRLTSVEEVVAAYNKELAMGTLAPFDKLLLETNLDNAILREGNLNDKIEALSQELTLAQNIEKAAIVSPPAVAVKTVARSRRNSVLVGALIGVIGGLIAAIVADPRLGRSQRA